MPRKLLLLIVLMMAGFSLHAAQAATQAPVPPGNIFYIILGIILCLLVPGLMLFFAAAAIGPDKDPSAAHHETILKRRLRILGGIAIALEIALAYVAFLGILNFFLGYAILVVLAFFGAIFINLRYEKSRRQ